MPILAIGGAAVASAIKVEEAENRIKRETGATGRELEGLEQSFQRVGRTTPASLGQVADVLSNLHERLGLTGPPLEALTRQILTLNRITEGTGPSVQQVSRLFAQWSVATRDQSGALDRLFRISQVSTVPMGELVGTLAQFGPQLRTLGFSLNQSADLLGALGKAGIDAGQVMGGLRKFFTSVAKSGKDPATAFAEVTAKIRDMAKHGQETAALNLGLRIFGSRGVGLVRAIIEGRLNLADFEKQLGSTRGAINRTGDDTLTFGDRFKIFKNQAVLALAPLGKQLFPAIQTAMARILPVFERILGAFNRLSPHAQKLVLIIAGVLASLGPLIAIGTRVVGLFKAIGAALEFLSANPIALIAIAVIGLGLVIFKFRKQIGEAFEAVGRFFVGIGRWIAGAAEAVGRFFKQWGLLFLGPIGAIIKFRTQIVGELEKLPGQLLRLGKEAIEGIWHGIQIAVPALFDFFLSLPFRIIGFLLRLDIDMLKVGKDALVGLWHGVVAGAEATWTFFRQLPGRILRFVEGAGRWLWDTGIKLIKGFADAEVRGAENIWAFFRALPGRILHLVEGAGRWLWNTGISIIRGAAGGLENAAHLIWTWITGLPGRILRIIGDATKWLYIVGQDLIRGLVKGIEAMGSWLWDKVTGFMKHFIPGPVLHALGFGSPSKVMMGIGHDIVTSLAKGMTDHVRVVGRAAELLAAAAQPKLGPLQLAPYKIPDPGAVTKVPTVPGPVPAPASAEAPVASATGGGVTVNLYAHDIVGTPTQAFVDQLHRMLLDKQHRDGTLGWKVAP